jgi:hypothetical protein
LAQVDYDQDSRQGSGLAEVDSYNTNGQTYAHSLQMRSGCANRDGGAYWVEYDLARQWSLLTAVIGLQDDSPASSTMGWSIYGDGKLLANGSQTLGTSRSVKVSVKNVLRLRVEVTDQTSVNSCGRAHMIFGNLQLTA